MFNFADQRHQQFLTPPPHPGPLPSRGEGARASFTVVDAGLPQLTCVDRFDESAKRTHRAIVVPVSNPCERFEPSARVENPCHDERIAHARWFTVVDAGLPQLTP